MLYLVFMILSKIEMFSYCLISGTPLEDEPFEQIEHRYWDTLKDGYALYGADVCGSATGEDLVCL